MAHKICPICEIEMTQDHYCPDYNFSNLSLEMELLDLSFELEPYESLANEHTFSPFVPEHDLININMQSKSVPLFLRL